MSTQKQAVVSSKKSDQVASQFLGAATDAVSLASYAASTGLAADLGTLQAELVAYETFMAGDKTGPLPAGTVVNPNHTPEYKDEYSAKVDENNERIITDGVVQYTSVKVRDPRHTPNVPSHILDSTTGLEVDSRGNLQGADNTIGVLLHRLATAQALVAILGQTVTINGEDMTLQAAVERSVTNQT